MSQPSFGFKYSVPIFPAEESCDGRSRMFVSVLRRAWLADSMNGMKVDVFSVYIHAILNNVVHCISTVFVSVFVSFKKLISLS